MKTELVRGPWKFASSVDGDFVAVYPDTGKMEFPVAVKPSFMRGDVWNEIGPLIASAPALLEALELYVAICGNTAHVVDREGAQIAYRLAQEAIALARTGAAS